MPTLEQLRSVAYKTELVRSRRLMRQAGLNEREALIQVLESGGLPLASLLLAREQARVDQAVAKAAHLRQKEQMLARKRADRAWMAPQAETMDGGQEYDEGTDREREPAAATWLAWFDGSARPNPGRIGIGGVLRDPDGKLHEHCAAAGHGDSNQAEYLALIAVLEMALRLHAAPLLVCGDSRVVIDSLRSDSHAGILSDYHARAAALMAQLSDVTLRWIPRRRNAMADALSQRAFGAAEENQGSNP